MNNTRLNHIKQYAPSLFFAIAFITLITIIGYTALENKLSSSAFSADIRQLSNFTYEINDGSKTLVNLPYTFTDLPPYTVVTLYTEIDAAPHESLYIKTNFTSFRLYVDNNLIYECGQDGSYPAFFIDPPTIITTVLLPDMEGVQSLRFEYLYPRQRELQIPNILIGDETAILANEFKRNGFTFLFSIILILIGIVMTGISLIIIRLNPINSPFLWLGLFAVATGVWFFGECDLTAFFIPYPMLLYVMAYTGLFTMAIPFLFYGQLVLQPKNKLPLQIMQVILCTAVIAALTLQLTGLVSLAHSLFLFHIIVPLAFIVFAICLIWEFVRYRSVNARRFALPILVLSISAVLEVINYQVRFTEILSLFFQAGTLFFIISMSFIAGRFTSEAIRTAAENLRLETAVASISQVLDLQREQYESMTYNAEIIKAQRHDLRHQLAVIKRYNNSGEKEMLNAYLEELTENIPPGREQMLCENFAVNAVALHYITLAKSEGIKTSIQLIIPEKTGCVKNSDMCIIIGNFLENAIEACKKITNGERFIILRSRIQNDMLVITMDNSFDGYYNKKSEVFYSRKRDGGGIGLSSVLAVAKKYNGNARFKVMGNVFLSSVYVSFKS